ncbi:hypothetical protein EDD18DRAFT_1348540 [Armillaria luteobubalina]|uniref:Uncharacterized protein n=1 Tax=Armillaria luteobubalina TaxID=153913 RepID=A0AA39QER0_9AGAR|nr:hypothetical protein EDD18DRAFT_1348540 [Armillaria luteobubalina]
MTQQAHEEQAEAAQKGERNAKDYLNAIDAAPAVLNRILKELALQMGWWFTVIAGGPDPADGGNICTGSFHVGVNVHQRNFEDEYTPEVRAQRACNQADLEALNATLNNDNDEVPPSPSPTPAPIPSCPPPSMLTPGSPVSMPSTPAGTHPLSLIVPSHTDQMLPHSKSGEDSAGDKLDPQVWQDATFGHDFFSMGAMERDQLAYNNLLGRRTVFNYEGGSFPLTPHAMFGEDDDGAGDIDLGFPQEQDEYAQPEPESQLPLLPSPTWDAFNDHEIDADIPRPSSMLRTSSSTDVDGGPTQIQMVNGKQHQQEEDAVTVDDKGGEDTERRMSKCAWKPPASCAVIAAGWLPSAVQYLMDPNLGSDWLDLLVAWQVLEVLILQHGSPSKGRLGANTSRPSLLTMWLQNRRYNVYLQLPASFLGEFLAWWNTLQLDW